MKSLNFIFATAIAAAAAVMTSGANALVILTLNNTGTPSYQQTQNNPCVIGNPSCNNPAGFGFNDINGDDNDTTVDFSESTQSYTVAQVVAALGGNTSFTLGVDTNQANQTGINLQTFDILINGTVQFQYNVAAPGTLINLINGNGYSDAVLGTINLASFLLTDTISFRTLYNNATDGAESFFLIRAESPPCIPSSTNFCGPPPQETPEPATLFLLGLAILGMAVARERVLRSGA